ncbi:MAG: DNA recombination protein RmuC [Candidatus Omnitrophica bacterium]|nr:DNA recombination protein RmuC [Candidatus Omnitrophota bacterium]
MDTTLIVIIAALSLAVIIMVLLLLFFFAKGKKDIFSKEGLNLVSDVGALKSLLSTVENNQKLHQQIMQELKGLAHNESKAGDKIQLNIEGTLRAVEAIREQYEESKKKEDENFQSLKRLENVIAGSKQKGIAGENIIREALSIFPPDMIQTNFKVKGKEVEFGLVLSNKKVMPIDSKWPSTELLELISKEEDPEQIERLSHKIQKEVAKRVSEVSQYLDPNTTTPWAVAAIPDSMYSLCKDAHLAAYSKNVILVSYSMLLPYLLMFFSLHLQYASSIDIENLTHYLIDIKRNIDDMDEILENKIEKAQTMLSNASSEYRQILGSIKGSISSLETQKSQSQQEVTHQ